MSTYTRPADWLTMPSVVDGDQKIVMLVAIYEHDSNHVAFRATGGGYTIDWGDGTGTEDVASGVQAERNIPWSTIGWYVNDSWL
jgi:hypothetical protein